MDQLIVNPANPDPSDQPRAAESANAPQARGADDPAATRPLALNEAGASDSAAATQESVDSRQRAVADAVRVADGAAAFHDRALPRVPAARRTVPSRLPHRHYAAYVMMRSERVRRRRAHQLQVRIAGVSVAVVVLLLVAVIAGTLYGTASYYQSEAAALAAMPSQVAGHDSVRVYDSTGILLAQFNSDGAQHSIPLAEVPISVVNATVATEDHDFWTNQGVDFQAIARAAFADASAQSLQQGGSTITQQLIKQNVLTSDPTFTRKIQEAILALGLTTQGVFTKSQILQMYLNSIPYGPTTYGIDAAATTYFSYQDNLTTGESAAQHLDLAQATMLAGIPNSPAYDDPLAGPDGFAHARARQSTVLSAMVAQGYITPAQASAAWQEAEQPNFFHPQYTTPNLAPQFVNYVQQQLDQMIGDGQLSVAQQDLARSGLTVYTTLNLDLQNHVQQAMLNHLCGNDLNDYPVSAYYGQRLIREDNVTNAAAVLVNQHTGAIQVLLGSMDYYGNKTCHPGVDGQFDVATQGFRQPGSSFKPLVYATAFEQGWGPATLVHNEPTEFWDPGTQTWYKPHDADNNHLAPDMTVRNALQLSQNIPAVEATQAEGVSALEQTAEAWGIKNWEGNWGLSSGIGGLDVHPIDMVQAYTVLANYGAYIPLYAINRITDATGNVVFSYQEPAPVQVLDPRIAFLVTSILSDNPARIPEFNVCSPLYLDPSQADCYAYHGNSPNAYPAAAKTGTADDLTNDWALGYTMDYTMGVWVGNDNFSPMNWVDGVTGAAPIWYNGMVYAERNLPKRPFPVPAGVHQATVTTDGITTTDWFLDGQSFVSAAPPLLPLAPTPTPGQAA